MPKQTTSLTIEHGFAKILVCEGLRVVHHQVLLASPQFFWDGLVRETSRVGGMLRHAFADMGLAPRTVLGAVPGFQSSMRLLELPKARDLDPSVVMPREAARTMGFSQETSFLTWRRIPDFEERTRWLVLAAGRRAVRSYTEMAKHSGTRASVSVLLIV